MSASEAEPSTGGHSFLRRPHRTMLALSLPLLLSLVAEPLTALVDTAFVARLGAGSLSALGVGGIVLSSTFWIFSFLGIGSQTEVARALGAGNRDRAREFFGLAVRMALLLGVLAAGLGELLTPWLAAKMGATGDVHDLACTYLRIRWLSSPAVLVTIAAFGILRGLEDMRTPLYLAIGLNALNLALDPLLIFGMGDWEGLGIGGAAWATVVAQLAGGAGAVGVCWRRIGAPQRGRPGDVRRLFQVGRDLFLRTALLTAFLLLGTRMATRLGEEAGAAHQAVRAVWLFSALLLDAFAMAAQTLVGGFVGAGRPADARRVAAACCAWSLGAGVMLTLGMLLGEPLVRAALVPEESVAVFVGAWWMAAAFQPLNALCFATDGVLWGAADYRYLRNAMLVSTGVGAGVLLGWDALGHPGLSAIWGVTAAWIALRMLLGLLRIWPGILDGPLRQTVGVAEGGYTAEAPGELRAEIPRPVDGEETTR